MSENSGERASDAISPEPTKAQVLPFERPQSELQKAVQQRAQETIDRERDRAALQRPAPWRRALTLALAAIPVFLTFGAAIGFVGALRQFHSTVFSSPAPTPTPTNGAQQPPVTSSDPNVVMLQPYVTPAPPPKDDGKSTVTP